MNIWLSYIFLGLSLSAPIGPINAAQLDTGIKKGFLHAWLIGLGAMTADILYMLMVYMGLVHFLTIPFLKTFLWLFGFFVLVYTGIESLLGVRQISTRSAGSDETPLRSLFSGFLMSLTNPMTILFWLGIYGSVLAETAAKSSPLQLFINSAAIVIGILLWDVFMAVIASSFRSFLSDRLLKVICILSGLSLIGFGGYFGYEAFKMLFLN